MTNLVVLDESIDSITINIELKAGKFVKIILSLIFILSIFLPLLGLFISITNNSFSIVLLVGIILFFFLISRYIFKLLIWHISGKEQFSITKKTVSYIPFIRYFNLSKTEFEYNKLEILFSDRELYKDDRIGMIIFLEGNNKIKSSLKISEDDFVRIKNKVVVFVD